MSNDYLELTYHSIQCFANDGKLLINELNDLLAIALRDGVVDDDEKRVLNSIFDKLTEEELTQTMQDKIADIKEKHF